MIKLLGDLREKTDRVNDFVGYSSGGRTTGASPGEGVAETSSPRTAPPTTAVFRVSARALTRQPSETSSPAWGREALIPAS